MRLVAGLVVFLAVHLFPSAAMADRLDDRIMLQCRDMMGSAACMSRVRQEWEAERMLKAHYRGSDAPSFVTYNAQDMRVFFDVTDVYVRLSQFMGEPVVFCSARARVREARADHVDGGANVPVPQDVVQRIEIYDLTLAVPVQSGGDIPCNVGVMNRDERKWSWNFPGSPNWKQLLMDGRSLTYSDTLTHNASFSIEQLPYQGESAARAIFDVAQGPLYSSMPWGRKIQVLDAKLNIHPVADWMAGMRRKQADSKRQAVVQRPVEATSSLDDLYAGALETVKVDDEARQGEEVSRRVLEDSRQVDTARRAVAADVDTKMKAFTAEEVASIRGSDDIGFIAQKLFSRFDGMPAGTVFRDCSVCPSMVVVPAGRFTMGSPESESGRNANEGPQHVVTIARPLAVGQYEITFAEWDACVADGGCNGYRPGDGGWGRGQMPVINVSWNDAQGYVKWLGRKTGKGYRLLSEAEWEYVARAGTTTPYPFPGDAVYKFPGEAVYKYVNSAASASEDGYGNTSPVGSFPANRFGLYDMIGNMLEWTEDCRHDNYQGAPAMGEAWTTGSCEERVLRGGSWRYGSAELRSAYRDGYAPAYRNYTFGFRVARTVP